MSTNIELVNKALALLNEVPHAPEANDVVLVIRELKANLLYKEADAPVAVKANAPIIKLDNVEVVKQKRGRKPGTKLVKKVKVGLNYPEAIEAIEAVDATEALKVKGKRGRKSGSKVAKEADAVVVPTPDAAGGVKESIADKAKKIKG